MYKLLWALVVIEGAAIAWLAARLVQQWNLSMPGSLAAHESPMNEWTA